MQRWQQRLFLFIFMGLFLLLLISQGRKENPRSRRLDQLYIKPFVDAQLNGVITEVRDKSFDLDNIVYWSKAKEFVCQDLETDVLWRYKVGWEEPVQVGDTIRKARGQNWFLLFKPTGKVYCSNPIDKR